MLLDKQRHLLHEVRSSAPVLNFELENKYKKIQKFFFLNLKNDSLIKMSDLLHSYTFIYTFANKGGCGGFGFYIMHERNMLVIYYSKLINIFISFDVTRVCSGCKTGALKRNDFHSGPILITPVKKLCVLYVDQEFS